MQRSTSHSLPDRWNPELVCSFEAFDSFCEERGEELQYCGGGLRVLGWWVKHTHKEIWTCTENLTWMNKRRMTKTYTKLRTVSFQGYLLPLSHPVSPLPAETFRRKYSLIPYSRIPWSRKHSSENFIQEGHGAGNTSFRTERWPLPALCPSGLCPALAPAHAPSFQSLSHHGINLLPPEKNEPYCFPFSWSIVRIFKII